MKVLRQKKQVGCNNLLAWIAFCSKIDTCTAFHFQKPLATGVLIGNLFGVQCK